MALTDTQVRQLRAKLEAKHVKTRKANGADLHYVEGWHVIAEANRIFGYDAWDRRTLASHCVWSGASGAYHGAAYTAKVRVSVRAGDITIVREGSGTGEGKAPTPGQAHDLALKGAETDATKRALATFGNPFGLALYDRDQVGVRKARGEKASPANWPVGPPLGIWCRGSKLRQTERVCRRATKFDERSSRYRAPVRHLGAECRNSARLNKSLKQDPLPKSGIAPQLVAHLKQCAIALVKPHATGTEEVQATSAQALNGGAARRSTRACSPSANLSAIDQKSICGLSLSSLVSSAGGRHRTRITSVSRNLRGWHSR